MSRFDNLDLFLQQQQAMRKDTQSAVANNIEVARADLDPLIRGSFRVLEEYYRTIVQPRTDLVIVAKKKEQPDDPNKLGQDHYVYMANFVPQNDRPYSDDRDASNTYWQANRFGFNDWHPNVALQFGMYLRDKYSQELKAAVGLNALLNIRVWGKVPTQKDAITHPDLYLSYGNGWDRTYSTFTIYGNQEQPEQTEQQIQTALTIATPNVLTHRQKIQGY